MSKIYQPVVTKICNDFLTVLTEINFFEDHEIEDISFAKEYLLNKLTTKFIDGQLDEDGPNFTDVEFEQILREIIAGSILYQLKNKGLVNSYEDDNTEEIFFLTEKGKELMKKTGGNISESEDILE